MNKFWKGLKKYLRPFLNIRFVLCFGVAWMITNGWAYIFLFVGPKFNISWMTAVGTAYLAFLWLPITPEKIVTIPLAMVFQRWFFKNDEKTRKILHDMHEQAKTDFQKVKSKLSRKKKKQLSDESSVIESNVTEDVSVNVVQDSSIENAEVLEQETTSQEVEINNVDLTSDEPVVEETSDIEK